MIAIVFIMENGLAGILHGMIEHVYSCRCGHKSSKHVYFITRNCKHCDCVCYKKWFSCTINIYYNTEVVLAKMKNHR